MFVVSIELEKLHVTWCLNYHIPHFILLYSIIPERKLWRYNICPSCYSEIGNGEISNCCDRSKLSIIFSANRRWHYTAVLMQFINQIWLAIFSNCWWNFSYFLNLLQSLYPTEKCVIIFLCQYFEQFLCKKTKSEKKIISRWVDSQGIFSCHHC